MIYHYFILKLCKNDDMNSIQLLHVHIFSLDFLIHVDVYLSFYQGKSLNKFTFLCIYFYDLCMFIYLSLKPYILLSEHKVALKMLSVNIELGDDIDTPLNI